MTKKIFITSLLVTSVFILFAGSVSAVTPPQDDRLDRERFLHNEKAQELIKEKEQELADRLIEAKSKQKAIVTPPQKDRLDRRRYLGAMEQYNETVDQYKVSKEKLLEMRAQYAQSKDAENKKQFEDQAKKYLTKTVESLVQRLQRIKTWASNHPNISVDVQDNIVTKMDEQIARLNGQLDNLDNKSLDELKVLAQAVREQLGDYNNAVKEAVQMAQASYVNKVWGNAQNLLARLFSNVNILEGKGINVVKAREILSRATEKLSGEPSREMILEAYNDLRVLVTHLKNAITQNQ
ncbi:MAG: hypothetical protein COX81_02865 [Candidatus Magasanikbacteria bacterium CG_4_10_14_0_2_um_filter_37_12]|uniref:DUF5667 domain-containing protein n=1 Tax=Candidatus Magasanikbacteria bacterium CG_4_10_14_0_2_um_filter_37_12 TaxID=1974637 RepID=A0A2M7V7L0_9BACT|nr:MAG: hypothetical protein COX81_02865 [Candidatus Magasanikbacteria bacterium CG_4_10_14_0_2_um_filter_37_12]